MKQLLAIFIIALGINGVYGQQATTQDSASTKQLDASLNKSPKLVSMDIDTTVFPTKANQGYYTQDNQAAILGQLLPLPFEQMKVDFDNGNIEQRFETMEKEALTIDDQDYLYIKQYAKQEGKTIFIVMYAKANNANSSILVTGFYGEDQDQEVFDAYIKKAALSAQVTE